MRLLSPPPWPDYELIDSGHFEKLERFGDYVLARPEPQACWPKSLTEAEWGKMVHVRFVRESSANKATEKGTWVFHKKMPEQWFIGYSYKKMHLKFRLGLTAFKHVGIFPEQAVNWNYIFDTITESNIESPKVLNLFAYTGGASLAARAAGAEVVHVDSVRQVLHWTKVNAEASRLEGIRLIREDAMKFVQREIRRGNKYNGIILDPPAYGRGTSGETWRLESHINELIEHCAGLMDMKGGFLILNLYSMGLSVLVAENLVKKHFPDAQNLETGELFIPDRTGSRLPLGVFLRFML
ncbi:MAG: class I SAM-dependent methyltransferase [Bacteroidetes bacterium]|nr:class I SAM-dependent methyltransferase [Bacteroidota bacterium]